MKNNPYSEGKKMKRKSANQSDWQKRARERIRTRSNKERVKTRKWGECPTNS